MYLECTFLNTYDILDTNKIFQKRLNVSHGYTDGYIHRKVYKHKQYILFLMGTGTPRRKWAGPPQKFEERVRVISGGRITIPEKIRLALGIEEGNEILIRVQARGREIHCVMEPTNGRDEDA